MSEWIYLNSNRIEDILALSTVLDNAEKKYSIVRTSRSTPFFANHPNVECIGHPAQSDTVHTIESEPLGAFSDRIQNIAAVLDIQEITKTAVCIHYTPRHSHLLDRIKAPGACILYLEDNHESPLDLMYLDEVCHQLSDGNIMTASIGEMAVPCIRGTLDLRGLLDFPELLIAIDNAPFLITNNDELKSYCMISNKPVYYLNQKEDGVYCNDIKSSTPGQIVNMVLKTYYNG